MNAPALARVDTPASNIRGFNFADMQTHGKWLMPRLLKTYAHLNQRELETWLRGCMFSSEFLSLYQEHSVCFAQVLRNHATAVEPIVHEMFVWCEDPEDAAQHKEAAAFYTNIAEWAKNLQVKIVIVEENSDVPHDMIKEKIGRLFERKQWFARV